MKNLKYLQKMFFLLVMGCSLSVVYACSDDDDDDEPVQVPQTNEEQTSTEPNYYVMYEIKVTYPNNYHTRTLKCNYTTDTGKSFFNRDVVSQYYWEGVYGPFKKGDVVSFGYESYEGSRLYYYAEHQARIYVKEGDDGTFTIKKEGSGSGGTLTYTIGGGNSYAI